jgi:pseudaminic acid biosynthesis-associated methylase
MKTLNFQWEKLMQKTSYKTDQENFWAGDFGNEYTQRNNDAEVIAGNISLFQKALNNKIKPKSIIEFGCNRGMNICALKSLLPNTSITGIDINKTAIEEISKIDNVNAIHSSILDYTPSQKYDLSFTKGVLIHINPEELDTVYNALYESSNKYILVAEYYNPTPVEISYRGHTDRLYKRDFAGEMLKKYSDLKLMDYGFCYHGDTTFPLDDITWFMMEKINS